MMGIVDIAAAREIVQDCAYLVSVWWMILDDI
jgi:hypothetical protein